MIYLDVACNHDNGHFSGRAEMLEIGNSKFEPRFHGAAPSLKVRDDHIVLSVKTWPLQQWEQYVGNMVWNRYLLCAKGQTPHWTITYFLIWLRRRRLFSCTEAYPDFYDWFNDSTVTKSPAEIHAMVCEMERT